ncbi:MAG: ferrous iron transporter B [Burkholderiales bacterium]
MSTATTAPVTLALVGKPNCGKTALFNRLTGARQKVANYAGVTVERKEGRFTSPLGKTWRVLDLPGAYSLKATTPDEAVTRAVLLGERSDESMPDGVICVVDATNLPLNLRMVLDVARLGLPMVVAVNMADVAQRRGLKIDIKRLSAELGVPVVETVAVKAGGERALVDALDHLPSGSSSQLSTRSLGTSAEEVAREIRRIVSVSVTGPQTVHAATEKLDRVLLHPLAGPLILAVVLFLVFQAVFSWAQAPMEWIKASVAWTGEGLITAIPEGMLRSLLVDGILAGVGSVLVFLPQILILFFFILALEESGYLPRAAFLLDRLMGKIGLSGRAFIPLLSSFACAIPGIMATRTIQNPRERLVTIMIAPLMTCSARLPVYALIIAAFIPNTPVGGVFNLQGFVLFALYIAGIVSAMAVGYLAKRAGARDRIQPLLMELPDYHWPHAHSLVIGLWERTKIFLSRVGGIILSLMIVLWFLSTFPSPPPDATLPAISYSFAGILGKYLEVIFAPIGFNWQISIALVPGLAAREVAVGALGTVYALSQTGEALSESLTPLIASTWGLPTALSLLAWYVFAPQCISTLSVVKRETNTWRYPVAMAGYLFALAYLASFITYRTALWMT